MTHLKRYWPFAFLTLCALSTLWFLWNRPDQWRFRRELPWDAQDVHEWYHEDSFLPDYNYLLKAKISEEEFHQYVAKFNLMPTTSQGSDGSSPGRWPSIIHPLFNETWWDPTDSLENTYILQDGTFSIFAKYDHGYLYLLSFDY